MWTEGKCIQGCGIDDRDMPDDISFYFAGKCQDIYTSVSYDSNGMISFDKFNESITRCGFVQSGDYFS